MRQGIPHLSLEINQRPSQVLITFDVRRNARSSLTHGFGAIPAFDSARSAARTKSCRQVEVLGLHANGACRATSAG